MADGDFRPRSFFLNEEHELARGEKEGRGGIPKFSPIDWAQKGRRIQTTLRQATDKIRRSADPVRDHHYFLLARPERALKKRKEDKKGDLKEEYDDLTEYFGKDSRVFSRLGMDLLAVAPDGSALVHSTPERVNQIEATAGTLNDFGIREKVRWATIDSFDLVPLELRIDQQWLASLPTRQPSDSVIELQPLLTPG